MVGLFGFGTGTASATSFCYVLVAPHSQCPYRSVAYQHWKLLADYDGGGAAGVKVCVRADYYSGGYLRACDYDYKYIYPNGSVSDGIVGNDSNYNHTIKGESWYY